MPYKDPVLRRIKQREATARWRANNPAEAKQAEKNANRNRKPKLKIAPRWSSACGMYIKAGLFIGTQKQISAPLFVVWVRGKRRIEVLDEPLPKWEAA
jgi:hypothetical protein